MPDERLRPEGDQPRRPAKPQRDDDDDFYDEPPRRRRPLAEESDATGGLIPYKNGKALASYYCGVFSLIPCVGLVLGPIALVLGFLGLRYAKEHPQARGQGHAIVGIVLGSIVLLGHLGVIVLGVIGAAAR